MSEDTLIAVTGRTVLVACSGWKPGKLLPALKCPGGPPTTWPRMSIGPKMRNSGLSLSMWSAGSFSMWLGKKYVANYDLSYFMSLHKILEHGLWNYIDLSLNSNFTTSELCNFRKVINSSSLHFLTCRMGLLIGLLCELNRNDVIRCLAQHVRW